MNVARSCEHDTLQWSGAISRRLGARALTKLQIVSVSATVARAIPPAEGLAYSEVCELIATDGEGGTRGGLNGA